MTADAGRQFLEAVTMFGLGCMLSAMYYMVQGLCRLAKFDYAMRFVLEFLIAAVCGAGAIIALIYLADGAVKFYHPLCFVLGVLPSVGLKKIIERVVERKKDGRLKSQE